MLYLTPEVAPPVYLAQASDFGKLFAQDLTPRILNLLSAIAILVLGLIVASIAAGIVRGLLKRTDLDNKIAAWLTGRTDADAIPIEAWAGNVTFWIIFLIAIVAFLDALNLDAVSTPLNALLNQVLGFLPQLFMAGVLLATAWLVATGVKLVVERVLKTVNLDRQISDRMGDTEFSTSEAVANGLYWFILLLFLPSVLSTLQLTGTLLPIQSLVDDLLGVVPRVLTAALVGIIGWFIAQIVRQFVTNMLASVGVDNFGDRLGLAPSEERQPLSGIFGMAAFYLVLTPTIIAALQRLEITAISEPATTILDQIFGALPRVFLALLILVVFYIISQIVSELLAGFLAQLGFNDILRWLGIAPEAPAEPDEAAPAEDASAPVQTPSELAGTVSQVGILLVGTFVAVDRLEIEALNTFVGELVDISGRVLVGVLVFAAGLWLANLAFRLIRSSGIARSGVVSQVARVSIIAFVIALSLNVIGIATSIVNLAFGLLLGSIAVALAIAFGWGGRDIASELLREWLAELRR